jgi:hypothetical protein
MLHLFPVDRNVVLCNVIVGLCTMIRLGSRLEEFNVVEVLAFGVAANNVT